MAVVSFYSTWKSYCVVRQCVGACGGRAPRRPLQPPITPLSHLQEQSPYAYISEGVKLIQKWVEWLSAYNIFFYIQSTNIHKLTLFCNGGRQVPQYFHKLLCLVTVARYIFSCFIDNSKVPVMPWSNWNKYFEFELIFLTDFKTGGLSIRPY